MKLKEQTVYIPTHNKSDFQIVDPTFGVYNAYVKTTYCLSKEELIDLLGKAYEGGFDESGEGYNGEYPSNVKEKQLYKETKEQFINQLIDNTKQ